MTDKEIVQALRRCQFGAPCARCPAVSYKNCMDEMHKCAADLIERQTAENAAMREKVPQWVSVEYTERLPLPGTRVIATDGVFVGEAYRGKLGEWRRYDDCLCWFDVARQAVTHWVPLPEAPEAPKGGEQA